MTVLAVLEQRDGSLRKISYEVVTAARRIGETVEAVVCAAAPVTGADQLGKFGADKVVTLTNGAFAKYNPEGCAQAIAERVKAGGYAAVVFVASATGKDLAPRVAAKLGVALAADCTEVAAEGGAMVATRPVYAGKALLKVKIAGNPAVLSLRPNVFTPVERPKAGTAETVAVNVAAARVVVREIKAAEAGALDVAEAQIVISGGRGLKEPANFKVIEELARADRDLGRQRTEGARELQSHRGASPGVRRPGSGGGVARRGGRRVARPRRSSRADGKDGESDAVHRRGHLGRDPAPRRDADVEGDRGDQQGQRRADLQGR